jgi:hypothetical protein
LADFIIALLGDEPIAAHEQQILLSAMAASGKFPALVSTILWVLTRVAHDEDEPLQDLVLDYLKRRRAAQKVASSKA